MDKGQARAVDHRAGSVDRHHRYPSRISTSSLHHHITIANHHLPASVDPHPGHKLLRLNLMHHHLHLLEDTDNHHQHSMAMVSHLADTSPLPSPHHLSQPASSKQPHHLLAQQHRPVSLPLLLLANLLGNKISTSSTHNSTINITNSTTVNLEQATPLRHPRPLQHPHPLPHSEHKLAKDCW